MTQQKNSVTCAVAIIDPSHCVLLVHPSGSTFHQGWSLPKGVGQCDETPQVTACREVFEETGLRLDTELLVDHGRFPYTREKDYHMFSIKVPGATDVKHLVCTSTFINKRGCEIPEVDKFTWVLLNKAPEYLNPKQASIFTQCFLGVSTQ